MSDETLGAAAPYVVQAKGWQSSDPRLINQFAAVTDDGMPDENATNDCGECVSSMILSLYGVTETNGIPLAPDTLKDWRFGQGITGVVSFNTDIMAMLSHFGGISTVTKVPQGKQNFENGLLDLEWQALNKGIPVAWASWYIDQLGFIYDGRHCVDPSGLQHTYTPGTILPTGWQYLPEVGHWRMVWRQTESQVTVADSANGQDRTQSYAAHYSLSRQVLVVPTVAPS